MFLVSSSSLTSISVWQKEIVCLPNFSVFVKKSSKLKMIPKFPTSSPHTITSWRWVLYLECVSRQRWGSLGIWSPQPASLNSHHISVLLFSYSHSGINGQSSKALKSIPQWFILTPVENQPKRILNSLHLLAWELNWKIHRSLLPLLLHLSHPSPPHRLQVPKPRATG